MAIELIKESGKILEEIKQGKWFMGREIEEPLLLHSIKFQGRKEYFKGELDIDFPEMILIKIGKKQIRLMNKEKNQKMHELTKKIVENDSKRIVYYLEKEKEMWHELFWFGKNLEKEINEKNLSKAEENFLEIIEKYKYFGSYFFIIFSLGLQLTKKFENHQGDSSKELKKHNLWRNSVEFNEKKLEEFVLKFLEFFVARKKINYEAKNLLNYSTFSELIEILEGNLNSLKEIGKRKKEGYVFFGLKSFEGCYDVTNPFKEVIKELEEKNVEELVGSPAFVEEKIICGEAIIIKDASELEKKNIKGKIIITSMTTPDFTPYLEHVKGIVTDEGGITSHAAIVSREMKIPCIIGTRIATKTIEDGEMIELNLKDGMVSKI
jgi:phosphohistidine swiveling domain-containing protein